MIFGNDSFRELFILWSVMAGSYLSKTRTEASVKTLVWYTDCDLNSLGNEDVPGEGTWRSENGQTARGSAGRRGARGTLQQPPFSLRVYEFSC